MNNSFISDIIPFCMKKLNVKNIILAVILLTGVFVFARAATMAIFAPVRNSHRWYVVTKPAAKETIVSEDIEENTEDEEPSGDITLGSVLEASSAVSYDYFSDAVFAGDSLTIGLRLFGPYSEITTVAYTGINTKTAMEEEFYQTPDGQTLTMADAINYFHPRKIYLMLGCNGINWATPEWLIDYYDQLTDMIEAKNPDSYIIIESIFATTASKAATNSYLDIANIRRFNELAKDMALRKGYYFLDSYSAVCNSEDGYLPEAMAANDGTHLVNAGYSAWFNYICTHTIKSLNAYVVDGEGRINITEVVPEKIEQLGEETEG